MTLPFSAEGFLAVFAEYNQAVWPAQVLLLALGVGLPILSFLPQHLPPRLIALGLALFWAWMGAVYHLGFFLQVNPLALAFGIAFVGQATLLTFWGLKVPPQSFRPSHSPRGWVGGLLLVYALILYPQLATTFGHVYPTRPTFGLPCPTTIATLGLLLWARPPAPWWLWVVPLVWSLVGTTAAFSLGILEDLGLLGAFLAVLATQLATRKPQSTAASA
jgi:hypothetical protein